MIHTCKCHDYNNSQCYNCLNGAHDICSARGKCKTRPSKVLGMLIVIGKKPKRTAGRKRD